MAKVYGALHSVEYSVVAASIPGTLKNTQSVYFGHTVRNTHKDPLANSICNFVFKTVKRFQEKFIKVFTLHSDMITE